MKFIIILFLISLFSCKNHRKKPSENLTTQEDSLALVQMIKDREHFMQRKDIQKISEQFSDDATWVNSQGYLFEGKHDLKKFHSALVNKKNRDYLYKAGEASIRFIDPKTALVYYPWNMFWYKNNDIKDTVFNEIGLMTIFTTKLNGNWKFRAITVQHTPYFYDKIEAVDMTNTTIE